MGLLSDMLDAAKALDQPEKVAPLGDDARRERIVYGGRCQGVGFRWTSQSIARRLGLTGWVRNLEDGTVEMEIQGEEEQIDRVIMSINADRYVSVERMDVKTIPVEQENGFRTR